MAGGYSDRPCTWLASGVIVVGSGLGGLALVVGQWWLRWAGLCTLVIGVAIALAVDIFADLVLDPIHGEWAEVHVSPVRKIVRWDAPDHLASPDVR